MFRCSFAAILLSLLTGLINPANAQRPIILPKVSSGEYDEIHYIASIPANKTDAVREIFKCVPQVGFLYRCHYFVLTYSHSKGRFVLYNHDTFWDVPQEMLNELLGPQAATILVTPSWYGYPAGFFIYSAMGGLIVLGFIILAWIGFRDIRKVQREKRWRALSKDELYVAAMGKYLEQMPSSQAASLEQHQQGFNQGVEYLVDHGIGSHRAKKQLLGLLQVAARDRVDDLKALADQLTKSNRWKEAIKIYHEAEAVVHHLSPLQAKMMKQCILWCEAERHASSQHDGIS